MIELSFVQFQQLFTQNLTQVSREDFSQKLYHSAYKASFDTPYLKGNITSTQIREEITLLMVEFIYQEDTKICLESHHPQVGLSFCLKGKSEFLGVEKPRQLFPFGVRDGFLYATAQSEGYQIYKRGVPYQAIYLHFSYPSFGQLLGEQAGQLPRELRQVLLGKRNYFLERFKLSSSLVALGESLFSNPFSGKSAQFYTEAKVIELLAHQIDRLAAPHQKVTSGLVLTPKEEQRLEECHYLLLAQLQAPPSLIELAQQIGLSSYRLKQGFRQKYGLSPFQLVAEQRLIKARALLVAGGMNVSEVAFSVGYSSIGSFSNSFFEKFGIRPSQLLNGG